MRSVWLSNLEFKFCFKSDTYKVFGNLCLSFITCMRYVLTEFYYFSAAWRVFQLRKIQQRCIDETKFIRRHLLIAKTMNLIET